MEKKEDISKEAVNVEAAKEDIEGREARETVKPEVPIYKKPIGMIGIALAICCLGLLLLWAAGVLTTDVNTHIGDDTHSDDNKVIKNTTDGDSDSDDGQANERQTNTDTDGDTANKG